MKIGFLKDFPGFWSLHIFLSCLTKFKSEIVKPILVVPDRLIMRWFRLKNNLVFYQNFDFLFVKENKKVRKEDNTLSTKKKRKKERLKYPSRNRPLIEETLILKFTNIGTFLIKILKGKKNTGKSLMMFNLWQMRSKPKLIRGWA